MRNQIFKVPSRAQGFQVTLRVVWSFRVYEIFKFPSGVLGLGFRPSLYLQGLIGFRASLGV